MRKIERTGLWGSFQFELSELFHSAPAEVRPLIEDALVDMLDRVATLMLGGVLMGREEFVKISGVLDECYGKLGEGVENLEEQVFALLLVTELMEGFAMEPPESGSEDPVMH